MSESGAAAAVAGRPATLRLAEGRRGSNENQNPDFAGQLTSLLESGAAMTSLPLRQSQAMLDAIRAQRDQIRALQKQLSVFDEQLTAFDDALRPLLGLGDQFKQAQDKMLGLARKATGQ